MYLKALELQGFKSFPEKTRLSFERAVTAIVGPNGSGKSNIADAIQWVMGEQSTRALRGAKMEDVIFGGTKLRPQMGYAEVSLFLDNTDRALSEDADEVQVTRRYYRSGESEYYINRRAVRLRDVNELFMDTGLGRDGYSIIGQGKIDSILSAKSTDRREVFEEAAGISRYRYRKEESERKLEHAEDDLLRVNDKIAELELQVGPLREQAETAKKYMLMRDELRSLEITLWLLDLDAAADRGKRLEADSMAAQGDLERARNDLRELYASGEALTEKMHAMEVSAEELRTQLSAEENRASAAESQAAVLKAELGHAREDMARIEQEMKLQEGRDSGLLAQIGEKKTRLAAIDSEMQAVDAGLAELTARSEELSKTEDEAQKRFLGLGRRSEENAAGTSAAKAELSSAAASMQAADDRASALISEITAGEEQLAAAEDGKKKNAAAFSAAEEQAESLGNVVKGRELRAASARSRAENAAASATRLKMDLGALRSRLKMLSDMEKDYEGYSRSVKTVMRESSRGVLRGVRGPAGELLKTESRYSLAIETAMGAAMQNVIVGTEEDGKAVIGLLKRQDAGRVTCLPMSVMRGTRLSAPGIEKEDGFEGAAIDLVSFSEEYRDIYLYLLGRTAVASDLDAAVRIARKFGHRFRIVTLDGQVVNAGGSMTGGSVSKGTGILSRAGELKELAAREKTLSEEAAAAEAASAAAKRAEEAEEYELGVARDELRTAEADLARLGAEKEHCALLVSSLTERAEKLRAEAKAVKERSGELERAAEDIKKRIAGLAAEAAEIRSQLAGEEDGRSKLSDERRALLDREAGLKADRASLEAERAAQESAVEELDKLRRELIGGRGAQTEKLRTLSQESGRITAGIAGQEREAASARASAEEKRKRISAVNQEKLELEGQRTRRDREAQDKNDRLLGLERESAKIEQRRQAASMEEKQIIDRLWDTYGLTRTTAAEQKTELESVPAAKRRTGELKKGMSALGTPNLGAIEEYQRVNERYTYLTGQRDDIAKSRTELLSIIGDITEEMRGIFQREFAKIGDEFAVTFTELFGGGSAELELEDPDNILECGIEIKVQPPGKALRTLTLLSGGEKAFVAIALYFAIIKVRPTPFVVMDEIEAALDEANVSRMSSYMRGLSDDTQFLVITHRRGTMEDADVLYGVTMQEQGVSRVLRVDLDEAEKTMAQKAEK